MNADIRPIDAQGRIIIPAAWRKRHPEMQVIIEINDDDTLFIKPVSSELTRFIDSIEVDTDKFDDYHELRKELRRHEVY